VERQELLAFLAAEIVARKEKNRPLKVGIDGRCAAGKSVLADELASTLAAAGLDVLHPSVDGFHHPRAHRCRKGEYSARGYYEDGFDYQTVIDRLLGPLSGESFPVQCRQAAHDVRTDMPVAAPSISVGAGCVLLFEGIFIFRRELNAYWDFRVLLDVDAATSLSRDLDRDTDVIGPAEVVRRKNEARYEPAWQIYVNEEHPESKADVIVDHRDFIRPRILKPATSGLPSGSANTKQDSRSR
jgi:uridine kinase